MSALPLPHRVREPSPGPRTANTLRVVAFLAWSLCLGVPSVSAQKIYWTEQNLHEIKRANLDGSQIEVIASTDSPRGIAVDVDGGKVYWTNSLGANWFIRRANLDGSAAEELLVGIDQLLGGITIDPASGMMYWSLEPGDILRANLDGTASENIVAQGAGIFLGLSLDAGRGKIYWTDVTFGKIIRSNLDGTGVEDILTGLDQPVGIAVDTANGKMYWATSALACPTCPGEIQRANLDGTGMETIVTTGVFTPEGVAIDFDAGKLYWADTTSLRIRRSNLDGTNVEDIISLGANGGRGIAIDSSCVPTSQYDFDGDAIPDDCDPDIDNDGVLNGLDVCIFTPLGLAVDSEGRPKGDMNDDCVVDGLDVQLFVNQLLNP